MYLLEAGNSPFGARKGMVLWVLLAIVLSGIRNVSNLCFVFVEVWAGSYLLKTVKDV